VDESAHYEFICKQAGIKVAYCAEQFDNDGSLISHIMKNIKRVMAAEFSRELSAKVYAGPIPAGKTRIQDGRPRGLWATTAACRREIAAENNTQTWRMEISDFGACQSSARHSR
jgi:hypothetical protein